MTVQEALQIQSSILVALYMTAFTSYMAIQVTLSLAVQEALKIVFWWHYL